MEKQVDEVFIKTPEGNFIIFNPIWEIIDSYDGKKRMVIDTRDRFMTKEID